MVQANLLLLGSLRVADSGLARPVAARSVQPYGLRSRLAACAVVPLPLELVFRALHPELAAVRASRHSGTHVSALLVVGLYPRNHVRHVSRLLLADRQSAERRPALGGAGGGAGASGDPAARPALGALRVALPQLCPRSSQAAASSQEGSPMDGDGVCGGACAAGATERRGPLGTAAVPLGRRFRGGAIDGH